MFCKRLIECFLSKSNLLLCLRPPAVPTSLSSSDSARQIVYVLIMMIIKQTVKERISRVIVPDHDYIQPSSHNVADYSEFTIRDMFGPPKKFTKTKTPRVSRFTTVCSSRRICVQCCFLLPL